MNQDLASYLQKLRNIVKKKGLKQSNQRENIVAILFKAKKHLTPEEILLELKKDGISMGLATIYRTLSLLEKEGMVNTISFGQEGKKYELDRGEHHDHMICIECGKIIEFFDPQMEAIQERIAQKNGFKILSHQMNLYGLCPDCQKSYSPR